MREMQRRANYMQSHSAHCAVDAHVCCPAQLTNTSICSVITAAHGILPYNTSHFLLCLKIAFVREISSKLSGGFGCYRHEWVKDVPEILLANGYSLLFAFLSLFLIRLHQ